MYLLIILILITTLRTRRKLTSKMFELPGLVKEQKSDQTQRMRNAVTWDNNTGV